MSAVSGLSGISVGVYSETQTLLATMRGPLVGLPGSDPLALRDVAGTTLLELTIDRHQFGGTYGRSVGVKGPDGTHLGFIYLRSLGRGVVYGLHDAPSDSDIGWLSSQDNQLQLFRLDDTGENVCGWLHIATEETHILADSKQAWNVTLRAGLGPQFGSLAVAALVLPPTMLRNVLSH